MSEAIKINEFTDAFPFSVFCKLMENLTSLRGTKKKSESLSKFIKNWFSKYPEENVSGVSSFYPVLRLLLPSCDYKRPAYGIGEPTMARIIINTFGLAPKGPDALRLKRCYSPRFIANNKECDFADVISSVLIGRCPLQSIISLNDLHDQLDALAAEPTLEKKQEILAPFIRTMTILELKWFVRLVSRREMSIRMGTNSILTCLHPAAPSIWNVSQDLQIVCQRIAHIDLSTYVPSNNCASSSKETSLSRVKLNCAFRPMLCSRANSAEEISSVVQQFASGAADSDICLEMKYDGERVQMHKSGSNYRFWSRSGREWTASYGGDGDNKCEGTLTSRLHADGFACNVTDCILDGEMLGFDSLTDRFITKATGFDVKRPDVGSEQGILFVSKRESDRIARKAAIVPCYIVFDILYLNGELLTELPLRKRKDLLLSIFPGTFNQTSGDVSGALANFYASQNAEKTSDWLFSLFPIVRGAFYLGGFMYTQPDKNAIAHYFDAWVANGAEGLVGKATTAIYVPGGRRGSGWVKLKPDYVLGLTTDIDCLIVGAYQGPSDSPDRLFNTFLLAVLVQNNNDNEADSSKRIRTDSVDPDDLPIFFSFCRVGNGFTREQLNTLNKRLRPYWKEYDRRRVNCNETQWLRVTSDRPDFWIPPRCSVVLQVHAAELTTSASFAAGHTLRFPRVAAIRDDKTWYDCATLDEIKQLSRTTGGTLIKKRHAKPDASDESDDGDESKDEQIVTRGLFGDDLLQIPDYSSVARKTKPSKKFKTLTMKDASSLAVQFQPTITDPNEIAAVSTALKDQEFCLFISSSFTGDESFQNKTDIERAILKASGRIVQNPGPQTNYVIADRSIAKIENLMKSTNERRARGKEGGYDIVSSDWLIESLKKGYLVTLRREHIFAVRSSTKARLDANFDNFGDSFTEMVSPESLRDKIFPGINIQTNLSAERLACLVEEELPEFVSPLASCNILLLIEEIGRHDVVDVVKSLEWSLLQADLRRLGALVQGPLTIKQAVSTENTLSPGLSHIVVLIQEEVTERGLFNRRRKEIEQVRRTAISFKTGKIHILCEAWAHDCVLESSWQPEGGYLTEPLDTST